MAKTYVGLGNNNKQIKNIYVGKNGQNKKIYKAYVGTSSGPKLVFTLGEWEDRAGACSTQGIGASDQITGYLSYPNFNEETGKYTFTGTEQKISASKLENDDTTIYSPVKNNDYRIVKKSVNSDGHTIFTGEQSEGVQTTKGLNSTNVVSGYDSVSLITGESTPRYSVGNDISPTLLEMYTDNITVYDYSPKYGESGKVQRTVTTSSLNTIKYAKSFEENSSRTMGQIITLYNGELHFDADRGYYIGEDNHGVTYTADRAYEGTYIEVGSTVRGFWFDELPVAYFYTATNTGTTFETVGSKYNIVLSSESTFNKSVETFIPKGEPITDGYTLQECYNYAYNEEASYFTLNTDQNLVAPDKNTSFSSWLTSDYCHNNLKSQYTVSNGSFLLNGEPAEVKDNNNNVVSPSTIIVNNGVYKYDYYYDPNTGVWELLNPVNQNNPETVSSSSSLYGYAETDVKFNKSTGKFEIVGTNGKQYISTATLYNNNKDIWIGLSNNDYVAEFKSVDGIQKNYKEVTVSDTGWESAGQPPLRVPQGYEYYTTDNGYYNTSGIETVSEELYPGDDEEIQRTRYVVSNYGSKLTTTYYKVVDPQDPTLGSCMTRTVVKELQEMSSSTYIVNTYKQFGVFPFKINNVEYKSEGNTTWSKWITTSYAASINNILTISSGKFLFNGKAATVTSNGKTVNPSDLIEVSAEYIVSADTVTPKTINFTFRGYTCTAEEGMTFAQWLDSNYGNSNAKSGIEYSGNEFTWNGISATVTTSGGSSCTPSTKISSGVTYNIEQNMSGGGDGGGSGSYSLVLQHTETTTYDNNHLSVVGYSSYTFDERSGTITIKDEDEFRCYVGDYYYSDNVQRAVVYTKTGADTLRENIYVWDSDLGEIVYTTNWYVVQ